MNILNSRFWVNRKYQAEDPADLVRLFLQRIIGDHYHSDSCLFDYTSLTNARIYQELGGFLPALAKFDPIDAIESGAGRAAFWINLYNLLVVHLVTELATQTSVRDTKGFFSDHGYCVAGESFSLDIIEHAVLRNNAAKYRAFKPLLDDSDPRLRQCSTELDPRIHFVLYSACTTSPELRVLTKQRINEELDAAAQDYLLKYVHLDVQRKAVYLPKMFEWYRKDFGDEAHCRQFVVNGLREHLGELQLALIEQGAIHHLEFDWRLNQS